jgi:hypothetical protein
MELKRKHTLKSLLAMVMASLLIMAFMAPATADNGNPSGNPQTDGWVNNGNSLASGVYVQGTGNFSFDIYTTSFTLESGSGLIGDGWQAGDEIVGLGGVVDHEADNPNLTHSVRIVSKFSAGNDGWDPNTGSGSFSGAGGEGALLLATRGPLAPSGNTEHLNPFDGFNSSRVATELVPGEIHEIPMLQRHDGTGTGDIDTDAGKFIYLSDGPDYVDGQSEEPAPLLSSWQVFVNVSMLDNDFDEVPGEGDPVIQTLQRSTSVFTDGYGTIQEPEDPQPEVRQDCMSGGWEAFGFKN